MTCSPAEWGQDYRGTLVRARLPRAAAGWRTRQVHFRCDYPEGRGWRSIAGGCAGPTGLQRRTGDRDAEPTSGEPGAPALWNHPVRPPCGTTQCSRPVGPPSAPALWEPGAPAKWGRPAVGGPTSAARRRLAAAGCGWRRLRGPPCRRRADGRRPRTIRRTANSKGASMRRDVRGSRGVFESLEDESVYTVAASGVCAEGIRPAAPIQTRRCRFTVWFASAPRRDPGGGPAGGCRRALRRDRSRSTGCRVHCLFPLRRFGRGGRSRGFPWDGRTR